MYVTGPHPAGRDAAVIHLVRADRMVFAGSARFLADPGRRIEIGQYLSDMVRPYRLTLHDDAFDADAVPSGHSYGEMAEQLIGALVPVDEPIDLLILAFAIHDLWPGRATATYLSHVCPGTPMAFAICDQGSAAAFTGLRLVHEYLLAGGCRRALLLVMEQATLPYAAPSGTAAAPVPARHTAVGLVCAVGVEPPPAGSAPAGSAPAGSAPAGSAPAGSAPAGSAPAGSAPAGPAPAGRPGPGVPAVRQHTGVAPGRVGDLLAAGVAELAAGRVDVPVVLGAALAAHRPQPGPGRVRVASPARPYTGVWWELVDCLSGSGDPGPVILADYDPGLGYLCLAAIDA